MQKLHATTMSNSSNNNNQLHHPRSGNGKPKPSGKGKEPEGHRETEDTPMADSETPASTRPVHARLSSTIKKKKSKLTTSQKKKHEEEAEKALEDEQSNDSIHKDLTGAPSPHANSMQHILLLQETFNVSNAGETVPGVDGSISGAPLSTRSESPDRLKPPRRDNTSSSASSCGAKCPHDELPTR
jgi:hypothetical protein